MMSSIVEINFLFYLFLCLNSIQSLNECVCCIKQDSTVTHISESINSLKSQLELVKYNLESMNLNMQLLGGRVTNSKDIYIGYLPDAYMTGNQPTKPPTFKPATYDQPKFYDSHTTNQPIYAQQPTTFEPPTTYKPYFDTKQPTNTPQPSTYQSHLKQPTYVHKPTPFEHHTNHAVYTNQPATYDPCLKHPTIYNVPDSKPSINTQQPSTYESTYVQQQPSSEINLNQFIHEKQSRTYDPCRKHTNFEQPSTYDATLDRTYYTAAAILETITRLNGKLTENVEKLELLLNEIPVSEIKTNETSPLQYDKHFNCVENCISTGGNVPKSCSEATAINGFNDGVYLLNMFQSNLKPFYVYCAHEKANEKGWMIIQRREDGSVNFNRNWFDYKYGFGNLYGEYWIGLERLHVITKNQPYEIAIVLKDYDGNQRFAKYSKFSIASENEGYKLILDCYNGDAGDSLMPHNYMKFSTFDKDNDRIFTNCAQIYKGGWWYNDCYNSNLNGVHYSACEKNSGHGINWVDWHGYNYSLKYTHIAIREV